MRARKKLALAEIHSDINIPLDVEGNGLGRGKRTKKPRMQYSPAVSSSDEEEDSSTLTAAPPIPLNLLRRQESGKSDRI